MFLRSKCCGTGNENNIHRDTTLAVVAVVQVMKTHRNATFPVVAVIWVMKMLHPWRVWSPDTASCDSTGLRGRTRLTDDVWTHTADRPCPAGQHGLAGGCCTGIRRYHTPPPLPAAPPLAAPGVRRGFFRTVRPRGVGLWCVVLQTVMYSYIYWYSLHFHYLYHIYIYIYYSKYSNSVCLWYSIHAVFNLHKYRYLICSPMVLDQQPL